jgi:hypothetical protein
MPDDDRKIDIRHFVSLERIRSSPKPEAVEAAVSAAD